MDEDDLTPAEKKLIAAAAKGKVAVFLTGDKDRDDPAKGADWGPERTIRADVICLLATRSEPNWPLHWHGVQLDGARITGQIDLNGARMETRLILRGCHFEKAVLLQDSEMDFLSLQGSRLPGLNADRMTVKGGVFLRTGFHATGEVRLSGADIGGDLDCTKGRFENAGGNALSADRATVKGSVFLTGGFHATGEVRLVGADIGGDLACRDGRFENAGGNALSADRATVKSSVFLNGRFHATGEVRLVGADIGGNLACTNGTFGNANGIQLVLERAKIAGALQWTEVALAGEGIVNFHLASAGTLIDDSKSWPGKGRMVLDGFTYESIGGHAATDWRVRKDWLDRQWVPKGQFRPQPYEQLIKVLRAMGHDRDARQIAMEKQRALREHGDLTWAARFWNLILGFVVGHGYAPWRVLPIAAAILFLNGMIFWHANDYGAIEPTKEIVYLAKERLVAKGAYPPAEYPPFNALIYSVDVFVPIVDLHQESYWLPRTHPVFGGFFKIAMWVHIALGWILTTLAVAGFTGLVKKD